MVLTRTLQKFPVPAVAQWCQTSSELLFHPQLQPLPDVLWETESVLLPLHTAKKCFPQEGEQLTSVEAVPGHEKPATTQMQSSLVSSN